MKKILLISIFLFLICVVKNVSAVENYDTFQEIDIYSGKMLEDYTDDEYKKYYKNVDKRKFWGWRTYVVNKNIKAIYNTFQRAKAKVKKFMNMRFCVRKSQTNFLAVDFANAFSANQKQFPSKQL